MDMIDSFIFNIQRFVYTLSTIDGWFIPGAQPGDATLPQEVVISTPGVTAGGEAGGGGFFEGPGFFIMWGVLIVGIYLLMFRPQRKREKKMREMQASIKAGDNVVTSSGMFGKVMEVGTDACVIEFGTNRGVRIPVLKSDIIGIREPKLTPPPAAT